MPGLLGTFGLWSSTMRKTVVCLYKDKWLHPVLRTFIFHRQLSTESRYMSTLPKKCPSTIPVQNTTLPSVTMPNEKVPTM